MAMVAPRACARPGCRFVQPCPSHVRKPWEGRGGARARGYDAEYERNRRLVMREEDTCWICGGAGRADDQADHVLPLARGGTSARENLRRAHRECNQRRRA